MGGWTDVVLRFAGGFPHGMGGLMYMVLLAAVAFLLLLAVYAQGERPDAVEDREDPVD